MCSKSAVDVSHPPSLTDADHRILEPQILRPGTLTTDFDVWFVCVVELELEGVVANTPSENIRQDFAGKIFAGQNDSYARGEHLKPPLARIQR